MASVVTVTSSVEQALGMSCFHLARPFAVVLATPLLLAVGVAQAWWVFALLVVWSVAFMLLDTEPELNKVAVKLLQLFRREPKRERTCGQGIRVHVFAPSTWAPNLSPFCLKVETYLRLKEVEYDAVHEWTFDMGPRGKLPYAFVDGKLISDSESIIQAVNAKKLRTDPNASLPNMSSGLAIRHMLEDSFYWIAMHFRWIVQFKQWRVEIEKITGLPLPLRKMMPFVFQRKVSQQLLALGINSRAQDEIVSLGEAELASLAPGHVD